jgi:hypothetical protein
MTRVASYLRVCIATPVQVGVAQILHLTENGYVLVKP